MPKISRRQFVSAAALTVGGFALGYISNELILSNVTPPLEPAVGTPDEALRRLLQGNQRYMHHMPIHPNQSAELQAALAQGQQPWGAIQGCIDSRVPPELVFDQGLGDLYVARTAGQVIDDVVIGSLEYAFKTGAKLIMVLGHQSCGAVKSTIDVLQTGGHLGGGLDTLVKAITPAVKEAQSKPGDLLDNSIRANVSMQVAYLKSSSSIISNAVDQGTVKLLGAYYSLQTGEVSIQT